MFVLLTLTVLPAYIGLDHIVNQLTLRQLKLTFHQYKLGYFGSVLYPFASNRLNDVYHLVAGGFALVGVARLVPAWRQSFVSAFVVAYSVMLLLVRVHEPRYIWVLYPLLAYATLYGLVSVIQWLRPRMPALVARRIAVATALVLAVAGCAQILRTPPRRGLLADADTQALFARLKEEGPATRVAFTNPRVLTLETGIPAMPLIHNADSTVIRELRVHRITHVITDTLNIQPYSTELFLRLARELPQVFRPIYRNPTFVLYRLDWPSQDVIVPKARSDTVTP
jgi:hypothetical protein